MDPRMYAAISMQARAIVIAQDVATEQVEALIKERDKLAAELEGATAPPKASDEDNRPASVDISEASKPAETADTAEPRPDGKEAAKAPAETAKKPPVKS